MPARITEDLTLEGAFENVEIEGDLGRYGEVVVSGISGRLPESDNIEEFKQHLINGEDMVTEDGRRWTPGMHGLPRRSGKLKDLSKFDASFFGVHPKQANGMDPQLRILLEVTYEAIVDAGFSPASLRGSRTGVFIGCSASEAHEAWSNDLENLVGYEMTGCTRSMFANRLSYFFDFKGPSYAVDTACSSSLLALDQALSSIRAGLCDAAIVGGSNLCLKPSTTLQFQKLGMLSPDGSCKSFDSSGNGYCRSEAVVAIFLQKAPAAHRIYATLVHSKNNSDGNKKEGITFPSGEIQKQLLNEVYQEAKVDPTNVVYVEAHGTGTKAGDPQEVNTIVDVFCSKGRQGPLLIGSTKSNMGHPEPASGLAAVAKVLIAMEDGAIPANLHFKSPNTDIPGLLDGRLQVVAERTKWNGGYVGINSFGFGGSNVHALLRSNPREPAPKHPAAKCPRLLTYAGRSEAGLEEMLKKVQSNPEDIELQALLQQSSNMAAASHPYRGYALLNMENNTCDVQKCVDDGRPIWYVFAGMGTQWFGMGRDLMALDAFKNSILRSDGALRPHGIHLYDILMAGDENVFEDTLKSFVGIAAIQVALVDCLKALGIEPDGIVGHSVGELGCAYADGGLTAEETVLAAYWRGRCVIEANLPPGGMAAVGLTWEEAKARCPEGVVPACHNSLDTQTISGPAEAVTKFVAELKEEGIFAKEVKSAGVAFHSYFMAKTAPALKAALLKVIKEPRARTSRWISSSIPESHWSSNLARYSSADYHVNNLVSPVLFQEALQHVPPNAITIEIAPHCLLQAILKRSLSAGCTFIGLMKRGHPNNMEFFLSSIGKLYQAGLNFNPLGLYPRVHFPVSRGTPSVSSLLRWDHTTSWSVPDVNMFQAGGSGGQASFVFDIDASQESKDHYLVGHKIDGRVLYPATGYLVLAWRALAKLTGQIYEQMPVAFENIHIHRATILPKTGTVKLEVNIMAGTGDFQVCEGDALVVSGRIYEPGDDVLQLPAYQKDTCSEGLPLNGGDIYKELRLRGYDYGPTFQGILTTNNEGDEGELLWNDNWVSFLDTMLQIQVLSLSGNSLRLPTRIKSLRIDPNVHEDRVKQFDTERKAVKVTVDQVLDTCIAGGAEILGLHATVAPKRQQQQAPPTLEEFHFIPYDQNNIDMDQEQYLEAVLSSINTSLKSLLKNGIAEKLSNVSLFKSLLESLDCKNKSTDTFQDSQHILLQVLQKIFAQSHNDDFVKNTENVLTSSQEDLSNDSLLNGLLRDHILKTCLDTVLENTTGSRMKVVELNAGEGRMFRKVIPQLNTQPMLRVDYTATGTNLSELDKSQLDDLEVQTVGWDIKDAPPGNVNLADVAVLSNTLHKQKDIQKALHHISSVIRPQGFFLLQEYTSNFAIPLIMSGLTTDYSSYLARSFGPYFNAEKWTELLQEANFDIVAVKSGLLSTLFLCRKHIDFIPNPSIINVDDSTSFAWVEEVKSALASHAEKPEGDTLWLTAESDPTSGVVGMVNCLRQEPGGDRLRCVFCARLQADASLPDLKPNSKEWKRLMQKDLVMNIYRNKQWGAFRHIPMSKDQASVNTEHAYVNVLTRGDLSSLRWIESPLRHFQPEHNPNKQLCSVNYTSLNFRDIMLATGKLPPDAIPGDMASQDCILGMEFSGKDAEGHRIMGLLPAKGLATTVDADMRFTWPVPDSWSLEEAASVPVVYATVYYALVVRGQIRKGDRVLIHSGSGGVGQAAISVALHHGCEVFTTVGSSEKRQYLKERFPQLQDRNFANSRDTTFEWDILRATRGRGVDVVLNSLAEEKLQASLRLLAQHGRFLEIGKFDLSNNTPLGMSLFLKNISFHGILLDALFEEGNQDWHVVADLLSKGIHDGAVKPLKTTVFDKEDIEGAFRFMAQGKHIGKVLIKVREETSSLPAAVPTSVSAIPRSCCHPEKTYLISGGLGGFGLELAAWLISRGAKNLVLTSRSGVRTGYQSRCIRRWKEAGVKVRVPTHNIRQMDETIALLQEANEMGPLGGIFHLAMVLRDGFMENQNVENFQAVGDPKVIGTKHLDQASRELAADSLDWFVVFSSVSCGRGNAGQANYGFANSTMERVCEQRRHDGFPGLAIQWGAIGDVGIVLDTMGGNDTVIGGTLPQRIPSCLESLDTFLNQHHPVMSSFVLAEKKAKSKGDQGNKASLVDSIANILGVKDVGSINPDATLADLGLDSLMGVEVKQTLERDHDLVMAMKDIRLLTVNKLREIAGGATSSSSDISENISDSVLGMNGSAVSLRYDIKQMMPLEDIVKLNEGSENEKPLFVIHPIEGTVMALQSMSSQLICPVYGLQCTVSSPLTSVKDLAQSYIQKIRTIQSEGPYRLTGYSFGACIAFEMALQLQNSPGGTSELESLILLDGSHSYVAAHTAQYKAKLSPGNVAQQEAEGMCAFLFQFMPIDYNKLREEMLALPDLGARIKHTISHLTAFHSFLDPRQLEQAAESFYKKLVIADVYKPDKRLDSSITLIRAEAGHSQAEGLGEDYGLKEVCNSTVEVHTVEGDHDTFLLDESAKKLAAIINTSLKQVQK